MGKNTGKKKEMVKAGNIIEVNHGMEKYSYILITEINERSGRVDYYPFKISTGHEYIFGVHSPSRDPRRIYFRENVEAYLKKRYWVVVSHEQ
ncbi:MAG: hypothetical protein Q8P81_03495 [Nanoarchaeota archaeon]|nr:hypothetical protein [Nanoarchaeota archaeon]